MASKTTAFSKVRSKIRRLHVEIEESEHEGGELNLVPYLDIVTNTVIFMLATVALSVGIANINVNAPRYSDPATAGTDSPNEDEQKLNLTVTVSYGGFIVAASAGVAPTIECCSDMTGASKANCQAEMRARSNRCPAHIEVRKDPATGRLQSQWVDGYAYKKLIDGVLELKEKFPHERQVILMADRNVPYQVVVKAMDTIRGTPTTKCTGDEKNAEGKPAPCMFDQVILSAGIQ